MSTTEVDRVAQVAAILKLACATYRVAFTEELLTAYATLLRGADLDSVRAAAAAHLRTSRYFPTPAELLAAPGRPSRRLLGLRAWSALKTDPRTCPEQVLAVEALNLVGGFQMLRDLTIESGAARRRDFVEAFEELLAARDAAQAAGSAVPQLAPGTDAPVDPAR